MQSSNKQSLKTLALGALGVVYGDIGTSPLYAMREALSHLPINSLTIDGVLSLIFWSLIIVISIKYLVIVLKADNNGEGGILALTSLLRKYVKPAWILLALAIIGSSLIIGDGMLTPAISVLSAVEGIGLWAPHMDHLILPITIGILIGLFSVQRFGTARIGSLFGPFITLWFVIIGVLGLHQIWVNPQILKALNPYYAIAIIVHYKSSVFWILGGVFLCMTGGEALYADIGHFGKKPIRIAWFSIVLPGLVLNYFGQGAYLLDNPTAVDHAFYSLAPAWFLPFLVLIATAATVIASQAMISAVFSIMRQATLLNLIPRTKIHYTSNQVQGQVYLPTINLLLAMGAIGLVLHFGTSSGLANAYGIAVNFDMLLTTILVIVLALRHWHWSRLAVFSIFSVLLFIDLAFLFGNLHKFLLGGWAPVLFALILSTVMFTWNQGFRRLREINFQNIHSANLILDAIKQGKIRRLPGTALFVTDPNDERGISLLHHLKLNRILAKTIIFLSVFIRDVPRVPRAQRCEIIEKVEGVYQLNMAFGFAEEVHIPRELKELAKSAKLPFKLNVDELTYYVEIISVEITHKRSGLSRWQKWLFSLLLRSAVPDIQFYSLPYNRTIAIGTYCQI